MEVYDRCLVTCGLANSRPGIIIPIILLLLILFVSLVKSVFRLLRLVSVAGDSKGIDDKGEADASWEEVEGVEAEVGIEVDDGVDKRDEREDEDGFLAGVVRAMSLICCDSLIEGALIYTHTHYIISLHTQIYIIIIKQQTPNKNIQNTWL